MERPISSNINVAMQKCLPALYLIMPLWSCVTFQAISTELAVASFSLFGLAMILTWKTRFVRFVDGKLIVKNYISEKFVEIDQIQEVGSRWRGYGNNMYIRYIDTKGNDRKVYFTTRLYDYEATKRFLEERMWLRKIT